MPGQHGQVRSPVGRQGVQRVADALEHFGRARELDPQLIEVDLQMGAVYEALGRRRDAVRHYERALVIDPQDEQARQGLERLR